jgi:uncharacterized protein with HXXEE motif
MTRRAALWLIPSFIALHNVEEAVTFRRYLPAVRALAPDSFRTFLGHVTYPEVLLALTVVTLAPLAVVAWVNARPTSQLALWLVVTIQMVMLVNALWHLAAAAFLFRGYAPGVVTAVVVNLPFSVYVLRRALVERWVSRSALASTLPVAFVVHGAPVLAVTLTTR